MARRGPRSRSGIYQRMDASDRMKTQLANIVLVECNLTKTSGPSAKPKAGGRRLVSKELGFYSTCSFWQIQSTSKFPWALSSSR